MSPSLVDPLYMVLKKGSYRLKIKGNLDWTMVLTWPLICRIIGPMFSAFLESFRYVGHLVPFAFLRIFVGYHFFDKALAKVNGEYLAQPRLASEISEWLPQSSAPIWYKSMMLEFAVEYWRAFAYSITYCEFLIAASFILGFFVRPVALLGIFLSLNYLYYSNPITGDLHVLILFLFVVMAWSGAGRCLGFDYFFFKRQRGLWW